MSRINLLVYALFSRCVYKTPLTLFVACLRCNKLWYFRYETRPQLSKSVNFIMKFKQVQFGSSLCCDRLLNVSCNCLVTKVFQPQKAVKTAKKCSDFHTFLGLDSVIYLAVNGTVTSRAARFWINWESRFFSQIEITILPRFWTKQNNVWQNINCCSLFKSV